MHSFTRKSHCSKVPFMSHQFFPHLCYINIFTLVSGKRNKQYSSPHPVHGEPLRHMSPLGSHKLLRNEKFFSFLFTLTYTSWAGWNKVNDLTIFYIKSLNGWWVVGTTFVNICHDFCIYWMWCPGLQESWIENTFRITDLLWGESTGHLWIPFTKGQWCGTLMSPLMSAWTNSWTNSREAGEWRCLVVIWRCCKAQCKPS